MSGQNWITELVKRIPLISGFAYCRGRDHIEAFKELFLTLLFTTVPLWVGGWVMYIVKIESRSGFLGAVENSVNNGDLFLYATSLLAPIIYLALYDPPGAKEFPSKIFHTVFVIVIVILSSVAFGIKRAGLELDTVSISQTSLILFSISIVILYIAMVYKNRRFPESTDALKDPERDFSAGYKNYR